LSGVLKRPAHLQQQRTTVWIAALQEQRQRISAATRCSHDRQYIAGHRETMSVSLVARNQGYFVEVSSLWYQNVDRRKQGYFYLLYWHCGFTWCQMRSEDICDSKEEVSVLLSTVLWLI
jgi:hypothetical protein